MLSENPKIMLHSPFPDASALMLQAMQYVNDPVKIVHCQNGRFMFYYLNQSACSIFQKLGFDPATFTGKIPTDIFPTQLAQTLIRQYSLVVEKKQEMTFDVPMRDANGNMCYFQRRLIPLPDQSGEISFIVSMMHDVSDEEYQRKNQQRLAVMLENAPAIFMFADRQSIFYYSPVALQILEVDTQQAIALPPHTFFDDPRFFETVVISSLQANDTWKGDCQMRTLTGKAFPASVIVMVQRQKNASEDEYIFICLDRREQYNLQQRLFESERMARIIINNTQQYAFIRLDTFGNIISWNQGAQRLFEYESDAVVGRPIGMLEPISTETEGVGMPIGKLINQVADIQEFVFENRCVSSMGRLFYAKNILSSLYDHVGRHIGYSLIIQDVTETRHLTGELRRKRRETEIFIDNSSDIILRFSPKKVCLFINHLGESITRFSKATLIGISLDTIIEAHSDWKVIHTLVEHVIANGNEYEQQSTLQSFGTGKLTFAFKALPEFDEKNRLETIIVIGTNITKEITAQEIVLKTLTEAKELQEFKMRFQKVISHELRTPLAGIKMSSDIMERYIETLTKEELVYHTKEINTAVREIESLLDNMLLTMKVETQTLKAILRPCDIIDICRQKITILQKEASIFHPIEFSSPHDHLPCKVDTFLIHIILRNILQNAMSYSPQYSPIHVWAGIIHEKLCITIHDTGMGITETDIPHIAEPFFRGKNAENVPGIGMGLFVARHCIELHEGIMNVQSELGKETTITITLPFVEAF